MAVTAIIAAVVASVATAAATVIAGAALTWAAIGVAAAGAFISVGISTLLAKSQARSPVGSASRTARALLRQAIAPARYVLGEARTGGVLFYAFANERVLHLAIGISEGDIEDVNQFFADGEKIPISAGAKSTTSAGGRVVTYSGTDDYNGHFKATCYLDSSTLAKARANGASLRSATGSGWLTTDVVPIAWVHLELTQGTADPGEIPQPWVSARVPWEFQVKGMRLTWPGQSTPVWTDDAAAIRYWFDTTIRGRTIDRASFLAARDICRETPPDDPPTIQLSETKIDMPAGESRAVRASLMGSGSANIELVGAPNDGLTISGGPVTNSGTFRIAATKPGLWRVTARSAAANPTTLLVEVTK